jgi:hypothetical protein
MSKFVARSQARVPSHLFICGSKAAGDINTPEEINVSCSESCPGKRVKPVTAADLELCLCDVSWVNFNAGPGTVDLDFDEQTKFAKNPRGKNPFETLWFRSGDYDGLTPRPAWKLDVTMGYTEPTDSDSSKRWQVGFIQNIESLIWEATYEEEWGRKAMAQKSRDTADSTIDAPWYGPPNSTSEPVTLKDALKNHPQHSDEPKVRLLVAHGEAPCRQIQRVTMTGTFNLWLIARDPKEPLDDTHVRYLWHATITADRTWELPFGKDPFLTPNWKAGGKQTKTNIDVGKGAKTPILDKPITTSPYQFTTHKKGKPCPAATGGSGKP